MFEDVMCELLQVLSEYWIEVLLLKSEEGESLRRERDERV